MVVTYLLAMDRTPSALIITAESTNECVWRAELTFGSIVVPKSKVQPPDLRPFASSEPQRTSGQSSNRKQGDLHARAVGPMRWIACDRLRRTGSRPLESSARVRL